MINVKRIAIGEILSSINITTPILFPYSEEEMKQLIFDEKKDDSGNTFYVFNSILEQYKTKINFSNVNFDDVNLIGKDLSRTVGIKFNPQKIYKKNLKETRLGPNVEVIGNDKVNQIDLFEGVCIDHTSFNNCQNVIINPQTVAGKDFSHTKLAGVRINGSFDDVSVWHTDFEGSIGAKIDPKKVRHFDYITSAKDAILLDLPEERGGHNAKNYNDLVNQKEKYKNQLTELIKDQLPPPPQPKEETVPITPPKQKRKWF